MFGQKRAKRQRLQRIKEILSAREATAAEPAQELEVSKHTISGARHSVLPGVTYASERPLSSKTHAT